ncbi:MAG: hypothetical protein ABR499_09910 [Gemmatimonadaceae bacterium]
MSRVARGIMYGAVAVLALATLASMASRLLGFEYALLAPLSFLVYAGVGAYVGLAAPVSRATLSGGAVGAIDATLGWMISYAIGPGRPGPGERITVLGFVNTLLFVACLAAVSGAIGGWIAARLRCRRAG